MRDRVSQKSLRFTESVIREMTRLATGTARSTCRRAFPTFPRPTPSRPRPRAAVHGGRQPVRHHLGRQAPARRAGREAAALLRARVRSRARGHGVLRLHRVHGGGDAGAGGSGRRGDHLRAVLRELRTGRHPVAAPCRASCGCASPTGASIPTELEAAFNNRTRAIVVNTPEQSDRQGVHARRARDPSPRCAGSGTCSRSPTRSTSTSSTTAPSTCRWPRSTACASAPSPSSGLPRPTASPAGGSAGAWPRPTSPAPSARFTIS